MVFADRLYPLSDFPTTPWCKQNWYYSQWRQFKPRCVYWLSLSHPAQSTMEAGRTQSSDSQHVVLSKGLTGLLGEMAAFSHGVKTSSLTMWGIIVLIFSFTYLLYFMSFPSLLSPGTWDFTSVFEALVTGTLEGLGPGMVILVPLLPLNSSPLRTYQKCCQQSLQAIFSTHIWPYWKMRLLLSWSPGPG